MTGVILKHRYKIIKKIGNGGFGYAFLAQDLDLPSKRYCVIKQLQPQGINQGVYQIVKERFQREAAILEDLGHNQDQIPRLYAYFEENNQFYLVQEYIEGENLADFVANKGLMPAPQVKEILLSLLQVLEYVHSQKIIHRDIKPENIILRNRDNLPVLIDFGSVKESLTTQLSSPSQSAKSIVIGTPGFMPPEQSIGRPLFASDTYALGLTAIYLLTGKAPGDLETSPSTGEFIWRDALNIKDPILEEVLDKAIKSKPDDRYLTAAQMLSALQSPPTQVVTNIQTVNVAPSKNNYPSGKPPNWGIVIGGTILASMGWFGWNWGDKIFHKDKPVNTSNYTFPKNVCGDIYLSSIFYSVIVSNNINLNKIKNNFCRDAFIIGNSVQVASFNQYESASAFKQELEKSFSDVTIKHNLGNSRPLPTLPPSPQLPTTPSPEPEESPSPSPELEITPSPDPDKETNQSLINETEAVDLIERWLAAKRKIFGPTYKTHLGERFLTGEAYQSIISGNEKQKSFLTRLMDKGSYYTFGIQKISEVKNFTGENDWAVIDVVTVEEAILHRPDGSIEDDSSRNKTKLVRYTLQREGSRLKISEVKTIKVYGRKW